MMEPIFQTSMFVGKKEQLIRILVLGCITYMVLFLIVRLSGNRPMSRLSVLDFLVAVSVGSLFADAVLGLVSWIEPVFAVLLLFVLHSILMWSAQHIKLFERLLKGKATLVMYKGRILHETAMANNLTEHDLATAVRKEGIASFQQVLAIVQETNGDLSAIKLTNDFDPSNPATFSSLLIGDIDGAAIVGMDRERPPLLSNAELYGVNPKGDRVMNIPIR